MNTTFVAISSMSGITCASDTDYTIHQLSKKQPLAVAVSPHSPIPWDSIINAYKRKGEPKPRKKFAEYAQEFILQSQFPEFKEWNNLPDEYRNMIFMGYGEDDLFPSVCDILLTMNEKNQVEIGIESLNEISHNNPSSINFLGNLESVSTLLWGATADTKDFLLEKHLEQFEIYKQKVFDKFKGTEYEEMVAQKFADYDPVEEYVSIINTASYGYFEDIMHGIDSFSIEEMVTAAETIVDAEVRLDHLSSGRMEPLHSTREIAVITRVEGLTWIKHSLYAL